MDRWCFCGQIYNLSTTTILPSKKILWQWPWFRKWERSLGWEFAALLISTQYVMARIQRPLDLCAARESQQKATHMHWNCHVCLVLFRCFEWWVEAMWHVSLYFFAVRESQQQQPNPPAHRVAKCQFLHRPFLSNQIYKYTCFGSPFLLSRVSIGFTFHSTLGPNWVSSPLK